MKKKNAERFVKGFEIFFWICLISAAIAVIIAVWANYGI